MLPDRQEFRRAAIYDFRQFFSRARRVGVHDPASEPERKIYPITDPSLRGAKIDHGQ
ncbi:hypothetical protein [Bailinhaonella thermotolerans]|uniref:hypothetical protein n=1 Tax=Bailinhaonella thermotolerans TaxID=1070861 RepID=UPI00192A62C2|nr:hypothetical protein [Bailinhaonella thermotolerans]